jgi:hypothetical protein
MLLRKRTVLAITFAGISIMAAPSMTRAADPLPLTMKPLQGISFNIGTKHAVSYFLGDDAVCNLTLMLAEVVHGDEVRRQTAARMTLAVDVGKTAHIDTADGKSLEFKCQAGARAMNIEVSNRAAH